MLRSITVENLSRPSHSPARVVYCESFVCRLRGLMFRSGLGMDEGLLLVEGRDSRIDSSIHMFFVPFDLAVFWIDSSLTVVDKIIARSWKPAYLPRRPARYILEIHPTRLDEYEVGDTIKFQNA